MPYREYKTSQQSNINWGESFKPSVKAPMIADRIFLKRDDAENYIHDSSASAVAGLVLSVINDEAIPTTIVLSNDDSYTLSGLTNELVIGDNSVYKWTGNNVNKVIYTIQDSNLTAETDLYEKSTSDPNGYIILNLTIASVTYGQDNRNGIYHVQTDVTQPNGLTLVRLVMWNDLELVQSDWEETNINSPAYIKNKPDSNYGKYHTVVE